jgi:hypothetical protein
MRGVPQDVPDAYEEDAPIVPPDVKPAPWPFHLPTPLSDWDNVA